MIADLVVNHTSAKHPWFQSAAGVSRSRPTATGTSGATSPGPEKPGDVVFPDQETSIWTKDRKAGQYYLHRFYRSQPDLNVTNPAVRDEIARIIGFWMELGPVRVPGGRGAVPAGDLRDGRRRARRFRSRTTTCATFAPSSAGAAAMPSCSARSIWRMTQARAFFGDEDGDELTMLFDFPTMQAMYLASRA